MFHFRLNRRSFLKATLIGISTFISGKIFPMEIDPGKLPEGKLLLYNIHTDERIKVAYRDQSGNYDPEALKDLNWILRCHYTGRAIDMDIRVIEFLNLVDKSLGGGKEIHIISGYRSPEYNELLFKMGRNVARNSLHQFGKAVDIRIPGEKLSIVRDVAISLKCGGVGYYRGPDFIHLDSGRFRIW